MSIYGDGLLFEVVGVIRRIPIEKRGTSKNGYSWTLGGVLLEVASPDSTTGSEMFYANIWGDEKVEEVNRIGIGKTVRVRFRLKVRDIFPRMTSDVEMEDIMMVDTADNSRNLEYRRNISPSDNGIGEAYHG